MSYLLLGIGVLCAIAAVLCIGSFLMVSDDAQWDSTEFNNQYRRKAKVVLSVVFLVCGYFLWKIYHYLISTDPVVLEYFGWWYLTGFVSRFLVLVKREELLSTRFSPAWESVLELPFWALGGPFVTICMVQVLLWEKNWFDS